MQMVSGYHRCYRMWNRTRYRTEGNSMCYLTCNQVRTRIYYRVTGPFPLSTSQ